MKKQVITAFAVMLALGLAITVYALNQTHVSHKTAMDCCAKSDSCPMKNKQAATEKTSCCDRDDCCSKGDSCPMKKQGENASADCCCKDGSCPMKKNAEKESVSTDMKNVIVAGDGENCCQGGDCCDS